MLQTFLVIAPLFLIIFGAAVVQLFTKKSSAWERVLNAYALNIGLPALIFSSLASTVIDWQAQRIVVVLNSLVVLGGFIVAYTVGKVFRLKKQARATLFICFAFGNIAYLGLPTLLAIFGETILPTASLIVAVYSFWMFSIGIGYISYLKDRKHRHVFRDVGISLLKNPLLFAVIVGLVVSFFDIMIPEMIMKSFSMLAGSVTPVVLVVIGLFIGNSTLGRFREWIPVFLFSCGTLLLLPALLFYGVRLFGYEASVFSSSIIEAAMPLAITPFALAEKYNLNKTFIARAIVLSSMLSILTIPFWVSML